MFTCKVLKLFRAKRFASWAMATPPRHKPRPTFKPRLEPLEERWCPDTTNDVLYWAPQGGSKDASLASNWWDQTKLMQGLTAPGPTNSITLSGSKSNSPIEITALMSATSVTVMNNYNNTLTVDANDSLSLSGGVNILQGSILTFVSGSNGSGSLGIILTNGANFTVSSGATLNLKDSANPVGSTYLSGDGQAGEYLNNQGTVNWYGTAVAAGKTAIVDDLSVPVANGTFNANGGSGGDTTMVGGQLLISGSDALTNNVGFYQTAGGLNLTNNAQVVCRKGYYQSGGAITSDATPCALSSGQNNDGDINIAGGQVTVDNVANSVSTLTFLASTVEIGGSINVSGLTTGGNSNRSDQLICQGATVTLGAGSSLNVGTTGTGGLGTGNQWTVMTYASINGSWGSWTVPPGMNSPSTGATKVLVTN